MLSLISTVELTKVQQAKEYLTRLLGLLFPRVQYNLRQIILNARERNTKQIAKGKLMNQTKQKESAEFYRNNKLGLIWILVKQYNSIPDNIINLASRAFSFMPSKAINQRSAGESHPILP